MPLKKKSYDYIVCGGGASGLLLLLGMSEDSFFQNSKILLIEKQSQKSNDRTWCFWETNPGPLEEIVTYRWDTALFKHQQWHKKLLLDPYQYKMIRGIDFYNYVHNILQKHPNVDVVYETVSQVKDVDHLTQVVTDKGHYESPKVFSSINQPQRYTNQKKYPVLQQHFLGWIVQTPQEAFDPKELVFMDFDLPQNDRTQFMYVLPFSKDQALLEFTLFSKDLLTPQAYEKGITDYLEKIGIDTYTIVEKETGCIPMTAYNFDPHNTKSLLHIGTAGGWTKASTGYTFQNTIKKTQELLLFLKKDKPLDQFKIRGRYHFYDTLFIDVLARYNDQGSDLFKNLFQKNHHQTIFRFLDEDASLWDDLKIMRSFPLLVFLKALLKRLF